MHEDGRRPAAERLKRSPEQLRVRREPVRPPADDGERRFSSKSSS
jgi:hypothetical protein